MPAERSAAIAPTAIPAQVPYLFATNVRPDNSAPNNHEYQGR